MRIIVAAVAGGLLAAGCMGGNVFGANPGDGGCGPRPEGIVAEDLVGTWQGGPGVSFTLKSDGSVTGAATPLPRPASPTGSWPGRPQASSPAGGPAKSPAKSPPASAPPTSASAGAVQAAGTWTLTLKEGTELAFVTFFDVKVGQQPATYGANPVNVSGTREEPWMYTFGDGDPDSCTITKYERTSRG